MFIGAQSDDVPKLSMWINFYYLILFLTLNTFLAYRQQTSYNVCITRCQLVIRYISKLLRSNPVGGRLPAHTVITPNPLLPAKIILPTGKALSAKAQVFRVPQFLGARPTIAPHTLNFGAPKTLGRREGVVPPWKNLNESKQLCCGKTVALLYMTCVGFNWLWIGSSRGLL